MPEEFRCRQCDRSGKLPTRLDLAFQPIFDVGDGSVYAYEALVRGAEGQGADWILERIDDTNRHLFDQEVRQLSISKSVALGLLKSDAKLSVNFDPSAVIQALRCVRHAMEAAHEAGLALDRIIFEFSEYSKLDERHAKRIISTYADLGFQTAIDDFGAGYSGLNVLANLKTDIVKIDMGLIRGIEHDPERLQILEATVRLLQALDRIIVAEGIETRGEMEALRRMGVRYMQGFYLGRPSLDRLQTRPDNIIDAAAA